MKYRGLRSLTACATMVMSLRAIASAGACTKAELQLKAKKFKFREARAALVISYSNCPISKTPRVCNAFYQDAFETAQRDLYEAAEIRTNICAQP